MPIFPAATRLAELARLGLSEPLIRLAAGELIHPLFDPRFVGPPDHVYTYDEDAVSVPDGPVLVPLWSFADGVQGVWEIGGGLEFIDYDVEAPDEFEAVARTEQGFLAWMFIKLHEDAEYHPEDEACLPDAAQTVGFRHYLEWSRSFDAAKFNTEEDYERFRKTFLASIDALKTSRDRRRR